MADIHTAGRRRFRARVLVALIAAAAIGLNVASPVASANPGGGCTTAYGTYQRC